jgi:hypothetical protein
MVLAINWLLQVAKNVYLSLLIILYIASHSTFLHVCILVPTFYEWLRISQQKFHSLEFLFIQTGYIYRYTGISRLVDL